jgi:hypothetical protein
LIHNLSRFIEKEINYDQKTKRARAMYTLTKKYLASGLKSKEFCKQKSRPCSTFHWWYNQYHKDHHSKPKASSKDFISLKPRVSSQIQSKVFSPMCSIQYPNGVILHLTGQIDFQIIRKLTKYPAE